MSPTSEPFNYFNYFTEVEEYFQQKRGTWVLLSTLDWALIDTWREAGIPLEVIFRGIDRTFEHWEKRRVKTRRINGLGFCVQEVEAALEEYKESNVGGGSARRSTEPTALFSPEELSSFFDGGIKSIESAVKRLREAAAGPGAEMAAMAGVRDPGSLAEDLERARGALQNLAGEALETGRTATVDFEQLERRLSALEEKLLAAIKNALDDRRLADLEAEADQALSPYKRNMRADMIANLKKQFVHKRLLEHWSLPRLSLFHLQ